MRRWPRSLAAVTPGTVALAAAIRARRA